MTFSDAIILGIVQGLTEFLPISSSGHLVIAQKLLGIGQHDLVFDVAAHVGTLLSIVTIYFGILRDLLLKGLRPQNWSKKNMTPESWLIFMVIVASLPTAVVGLGFKNFLEESFSDMKSLGICFIISGLILLLTRLKGSTSMTKDQLMKLDGVEKITAPKAFWIGLAQALAILPSISRSGSTIVAGLLLGLPASVAALFSFIMSLPAIGGAALLELRHIEGGVGRFEILGAGFFAAYLSGLVGLWAVLQSVKKGRLDLFSGYMVVVGCFILWAWT